MPGNLEDDAEFKLKRAAYGLLSGLDHIQKIWKYSFLLYKSQIDGMSQNEIRKAQEEAIVFLKSELSQGSIDGRLKEEVEESIHFYDDRQRFNSPMKYIIKDISDWFRRR